MSRPPWAAHFGLTRTPFGKSIAAGDLFARQAHAEAVAGSPSASSNRRWESSPATSAQARPSHSEPPSPHSTRPATRSSTSPTPAFVTRGLYVTILRSLGADPRYLKAELMAQAADLLAAETAERHRRVVLVSPPVLRNTARTLGFSSAKELEVAARSRPRFFTGATGMNDSLGRRPSQMFPVGPFSPISK